jgi:pimeloyl-ACP methyl ester carboxylesterase
MTIPSVYLICEDDIAMPVCVQENMVRQAQDAGAPMTSERIRCGHSPFLSHPEETANFMMKAASQSRP